MMMSKSYELVTIPQTCRQGYTVPFKQSYSFPFWALLVCVINLSEALVLAHCRCLLSCLLSVTFKPTCMLFASFSSHVCCSSGIMLSMRYKTVQLNHVFLSLHMPIMFHLVRQTNRHAVRWISAEWTNVGLAHTHLQLHTSICMEAATLTPGQPRIVLYNTHVLFCEIHVSSGKTHK